MQKIRFGIKEKMIIFIVVLIILTVFSLGFYALNNLNATLYQQKQAQVKEMVEAAQGVINYYYQQQASGSLTKDQAQQRAAAAVEKMTFGPGNKDYFWINNHQPEIIMHPYSKNLIGQNVGGIQDKDGKYLFKEMVATVEANSAGFVEYKWQYYDNQSRIEPKLSFVKEFEPWGWIVGTGVYLDNIRSSYLELRNKFLLIGIIILLVALVLTYLIANYLAQPVKFLTGSIDKLAGFDLRLNEAPQLAKYSKRKDEIGAIAAALQEMQFNLGKSITEESDIANNLAASSQELSASSQEMSASADEVSSSINRLAAGTVEQNKMLSRTKENIEELENKIDIISDKSEIIKAEAIKAGTNIEQGNEAVNITAQQISLVVDNQQHVLARVTELDQLSGQIGKIIEIITGIAAQTNLLALNAAIEAARAGEAGRGFSVVAEEIRGLAEESAQATDEINTLIKEIQNKVDDTTRIIAQSDQGVKASNEAVNEVENTFIEIEDVVEKLIALIKEIAGNSQDMKLSSSEVTKAIEEITEISSQSAVIAEQVATASDEQSNSTIEIVSAAEDLAEMAQSLTVLISKYKN